MRGSGRRIEPATREPMAAEEPPRGQRAAAREPVPPERQPRVLGARRPEPARAGQQWRDPALVDPHEPERQARGPARQAVHPPLPRTRAAGGAGGEPARSVAARLTPRSYPGSGARTAGASAGVLAAREPRAGERAARSPAPPQSTRPRIAAR